MRPREVIDKYGRCIELISMDPFFNEVTVGLFFKEPLITIYSYSKKDGLENRLQQIRDRIVDISGAIPSDESNQATFPCSMKDGCCSSPLRFVIKEAVMKDRPNDLSNGITCKDLRSEMILKIDFSDEGGINKYTVSGDGNAPKPEIRYRAVVNGLLKYGGFEKIDNFSFKLKCNTRNDKVVNLLLPLARNISATEESLAADDLAGQMTTQSLGFAAN
ncbi:MAG: hypothetical protein CL769_00660 [Chloroflexi bacterium]|nr:hypothetical protein [Chloroflexota bacterium]|tara:strand:+ start:976 stop:1629 length:654 start_codon:yes stop_codon:yes gene_type:complete